jgi:myotubularin-related protein 6/7/8
VTGSLHLTNHHLIFKYIPPTSGQENPDLTPPAPPRQRELWITYPIIANCLFRISPSSLTPSAIHLRCRDFSYVAFHFPTDEQAKDVYESIRALTCKLGRIEKLYAFSFKPPPPEAKYNGWDLYDTKREFARQGISSKSADRGWRLSKINHNYEVRLRSSWK